MKREFAVLMVFALMAGVVCPLAFAEDLPVGAQAEIEKAMVPQEAQAEVQELLEEAPAILEMAEPVEGYITELDLQSETPNFKFMGDAEEELTIYLDAQSTEVKKEGQKVDFSKLEADQDVALQTEDKDGKTYAKTVEILL